MDDCQSTMIPPPRVLLVDDSATVRHVLGQRLQALGCDVDQAADGAAALAALGVQSYGLVLLDCHLPDMYGHDVAQRLRALEAARPARSYTPLIGMSADADAAHVRLCLERGMDGMLDKPVPIESLRAMLSLWCDHESGGLDAAAAGPALAGTPLPQLFLSASREDLQGLRAACARDDGRAMARLAHRMKGAALTVGRDDIVALLDCVEEALCSDAASRAALPLLLESLGRMLAR